MFQRLITAEETLPLRQRVLRPGRGIETCHFDGDDLITTFHVGGFEEDQLVAIASVFQRPHPQCLGDDAHQLRGMAVVPQRQQSGLGSELLAFVEAEVIRRGGGRLWCNARKRALGFYQRLGYRSIGDRFEIEGVGTHYFCIKSLGRQPRNS